MRIGKAPIFIPRLDLYTRDFEWNLNKTIDGPVDLMIEISNWEYSKWYIQIKPFVTSRTIYSIYGETASIELTSDSKVSIAVGSKNPRSKQSCLTLFSLLHISLYSPNFKHFRLYIIAILIHNI